MLHCYDAPTVLYYRGNANLNESKIISIIGTRSNTDYGKQITEEIIETLQPHQALITSGLAYGIDAVAHKTCVNNNIATVGILIAELFLFQTAIAIPVVDSLIFAVNVDILDERVRLLKLWMRSYQSYLWD